MPVFLLVVTEGLLEIPAAQKVFTSLGIDHDETRFVPKGGRDAFWRDALKYNQASLHIGPVLGIADLEQDTCASALIFRFLPQGCRESFVLRVAVRMLEAWLLADREAMAAFLRIPVNRMPTDPDALQNPKQALVNLARQSARRQIVDDIVPRDGSPGVVGRGYMSRMTEFIRDSWRPGEARANSDSFRRALAAIEGAIA